MKLAGSTARPGAAVQEDGTTAFRVWAPRARSLELVLVEPRRIVPLEAEERGYFAASVENVPEGALYRFRLDGRDELPDPASRSQPRGVHGPSAVVGTEFDWTDHGWRNPPLREYVMYELHVGTFTTEGNFDAVVPHLPYLRELGITAVELMPVAQFPGDRNWGYDGAFPYAVQDSYGGPAGLKRLVDACHASGLAVILDVVYNHVGPEGACQSAFGHYFTERYHTPWGAALNFDGPHSDEVREYFIGNALQWTTEFHIDALRLDAVHAILDTSAQPFLADLAARVRAGAEEASRDVYLIAESDLGDPRMIRPASLGGMNMDAQWLDDFHHALHTLITDERTGYYEDFGSLDQLARSFRNGFVYTGQYSRHRMRRHGAPAPDARPHQFVVFAQNHDQVGNRMLGDRLAVSASPAQLRVAAAAVLLSPFQPLLFMGEEYGEVAPFPYFVSHADPALIEAVRMGRAREFASFSWAGEPPDPQSEATFRNAQLDHELRLRPQHRALLDYHRTLIRMRRDVPSLTRFSSIDCDIQRDVLIVVRSGAVGSCCLALNFSAEDEDVSLPNGAWRLLLDSESAEPAVGAQDSVIESTIRLRPWAAALLIRAT